MLPLYKKDSKKKKKGSQYMKTKYWENQTVFMKRPKRVKRFGDYGMTK